MRRLCEREHPPGVVTYLDGEPVGWCSIGPRSEIPRLAASKLIRPVDDVPVWSIICVVVRSGFRKQGVTARDAGGSGRVRPLAGRACGGGASGRPARPDGPDDGVRRHKAMFEKAGFEVVGTTDAVASKMPRLVMRRDLA